MSSKGRTQKREVARIAAKQHGVISMRQLLALEFAASTVVVWCDFGQLQPVHRGVYAVGHGRLAWEGRCMAAVLAADPLAPERVAAASHFSAAWIWGLLQSRPSTIHVTAPVRRRAKRAFVVHFSRLEARDRAEHDGLPVSAVPRTLLDLAASARSDSGLGRYLERAEGRDLLDLFAVEDLLKRCGGHRGRGRLTRALDIYRPEPAFTRSGLERRFLELVREVGLPTPAMNYSVGGYELDSYWEAERFAVELDVYETHGSHAAFERDRIRQEDLLLLGIGMTRVTGPRLQREPRKVMARIATLLEQRRDAR
jgi:predicted transcriptional regulator of viral defense system